MKHRATVLNCHHSSLSRVVALAALVLTATALTAPALASEFAAAIDLASLNGSTGFRLDGIDASDASGFSVASAGDVNGDGFDDILIGAKYGDPGGDYAAGETYVVFGKASGFASAIDLASLNGTTGFRLDGIDVNDFSGVSVSSAGDVNGDGFADIIIGAFGGDPGGNSGAGENYVVFGKASGFAAALDLASLNGTTGFRLDGIDTGDNSGTSVTSVGDVNGDGFGDILIGTSRGDPGGDSVAGESYIVFGKASDFAAAIDLSTLNGNNGFRLDGIDVKDYSGASVSSAGDVNGDGFDDILIGAYGGDPGGDSYAGESYVVFGKASGFAAAIDLSTLGGGNGFRLDGIDANDYSGRPVSSAGDVNGDGFDDILIGALYGDPGGDSYAGESYVVFGKASGFAAAFDLSTLNGNNGFRLDGIDVNDFSGISASSAGDVNGDGFDDIIIGASGGDPGGDSYAGESYVVFGKASGFATAIDLSTLNGGNGFRLDGVDVKDYSGRSVSSAGDVNGDGFDDVLIGAYGGDPGGDLSAGKTYVVFGRAPNTARTRFGSAAGQYISGGAFADKLNGLGGGDTLEGRGAGDALNGGAGKDTASYRHAAAAVTADLVMPAGNKGDAAGDSYTAIENLTGSAFKDVLLGNSLANVLTGGKGSDIGTGRGGADVFRLEKLSDSPPGTGRDRIADFNAGSAGTSVDRIDLSAIDAKSGAGNQFFTFIGTAAFSSAKGQLRVQQAGTTAIVSGDVNGDGIADFEISLLNFTNLANLTSIDFIR